ncbi:GGIII-like transmembrane region-containing protein [endosymbiont GvMRE of Glomus versiforme]|uniref:GGIII-like transmembrane region-containing protein n=1 Tax=endosymbiont GvMRE of Glomus versiforme TaxID=2039283 RepID=UPI000EC3ED1E|nr:GGIII-like transmembrane region-containing protein [endosymbiont GvMRE of Glomus versiforme]RHZ37775.1 hypothetical protein GvMRE_I1g328 [endosymbiont GvMRE of Glomus versiforme]
MSDSKDKNEKMIKTNWKDKDGNKYKIEVKVGEEKKNIKPEKKGKDGKEGPDITVKGVEKGFFKHKFTVNGKEESSLAGGIWIVVGGGAALLLAIIGLVFLRKKKNKKQEEAL